MDHSNHNMMMMNQDMPTDSTTMASVTSSSTVMSHANMKHANMNHGAMAMATSDGGSSSNQMSMSSHSMPMVFNADYSGFKVLFTVWEVDDPWQFFITLLACFVVGFLYELLRIYRHNHFIKDCKSRKRFACFGATAASLPSTPRPTSAQSPYVTELKSSCCHSDAAPSYVVPVENTNGLRKSVEESECCSKSANNGGIANNNNNNNSNHNNLSGNHANATAESTVVLLSNTTIGTPAAAQRTPSTIAKRRVQPGNMNILSPVHIVQTVMHIVLTALGFLLMLAVMTFNVWVFMSVVAGVGAAYFLSGHLLESPVDANSCCL